MQRRAALRSDNRPGGFTLVELLVVISITALLIAILLPSLKKARDQAKDSVCRSNLHQLGLAIRYYVSDNKDRLLWIKGKKVPGSTPPRYTIFPFRQYHQIFHLLPYLKDFDLYLCPQAESPVIDGHPGGLRGPRTVRAYLQGDETGDKPGPISFYKAIRDDSWFIELYKRSEFPPSVDPYTSPTRYLDELYTEYWFNDWNEGAGSIPAISGNVINRIPFPEQAVMMSDALPWNPRHNGGNHFLFLDAHVSHIPELKYFDPEGRESYEDATDKDIFGNRPFWAWGLGKGVDGDSGD